MHCLMVMYPEPVDKARFESYYEQSHIPLAKLLPALKSFTFAYPVALGPGSPPFCVFQAWFDSAEAMIVALQSEIGQKVAADVPNYSPGGATLCHFEPGGCATRMAENAPWTL